MDARANPRPPRGIPATPPYAHFQPSGSAAPAHPSHFEKLFQGPPPALVPAAPSLHLFALERLPPATTSTVLTGTHVARPLLAPPARRRPSRRPRLPPRAPPPRRPMRLAIGHTEVFSNFQRQRAIAKRSNLIGALRGMCRVPLLSFSAWLCAARSLWKFEKPVIRTTRATSTTWLDMEACRGQGRHGVR